MNGFEEYLNTTVTSTSVVSRLGDSLRMITTVIDHFVFNTINIPRHVGFLCSRKNWIHKKHMSSLSNLLTNIVLPAAILTSFNVNRAA
ncbi:hypothetical protein [Staphylococcus pseudoxylosus]|uniref:hypothetical protein n=1 Tax=Staphylococcus pseudoxylosus TaxID=2282419 RepID=UPI003D807140